MGKRKHILLADDENGFRYSASVALRRAGYRVTVARDGEDAVARAIEARVAGEEVDLVVTDHRMPGMTGMEMVAVLRERGFDVPVVVVTAFRDSSSASELAIGHSVEFIEKPFLPEDLVACLKRVLGAAA